MTKIYWVIACDLDTFHAFTPFNLQSSQPKNSGIITLQVKMLELRRIQ